MSTFCQYDDAFANKDIDDLDHLAREINNQRKKTNRQAMNGFMKNEKNACMGINCMLDPENSRYAPNSLLNNFTIPSNKNLLFRDSNISIVIQESKLIEFSNYDSSLIYNNKEKIFKTYLDFEKHDSRAQLFEIDLKNKLAIIKFENKIVSLDTMYKFLNQDTAQNKSVMSWSIKDCHLAFVFSYKQLSMISFGTNNNRSSLKFDYNNKNELSYWSFFLKTAEDNEFILNNNYDGEINLIHYYNTPKRVGFYLPSIRNNGNKFEKVYQFHNPLAQKRRSYDDSEVILNLKGKSRKPDTLDILNWQFIVREIFEGDGGKLLK